MRRSRWRRFEPGKGVAAGLGWVWRRVGVYSAGGGSGVGGVGVRVRVVGVGAVSFDFGHEKADEMFETILDVFGFEDDLTFDGVGEEGAGDEVGQLFGVFELAEVADALEDGLDHRALGGLFLGGFLGFKELDWVVESLFEPFGSEFDEFADEF